MLCGSQNGCSQPLQASNTLCGSQNELLWASNTLCGSQNGLSQHLYGLKWTPWTSTSLQHTLRPCKLSLRTFICLHHALRQSKRTPQTSSLVPRPHPVLVSQVQIIGLAPEVWSGQWNRRALLLEECGGEKYFNRTAQSVLWDSLSNTEQFVILH